MAGESRESRGNSGLVPTYVLLPLDSHLSTLSRSDSLGERHEGGF